MKRREEKSEALTLQFLEKKYQQEKQILTKQNKELSEQLMNQIERSNQLAFKLEKSQQTDRHKYDQLLRQNQFYKARVLQLQKQQESISVNEELQFQNLNEQKRLIIQNQTLQRQKQQLQTIVQKIYQQKIKMEKQIHINLQNQRELQQQMQILAEKHQQYKRQSQRQINQLSEINASILQEKEREALKLGQQKKKKKELQKKVQQLQKMSQNIKFEQQRLQQQIESIQAQKDRQHQKNVEINTKLALAQSKITNLQNFITKTEQQLRDSDKKLNAEKDLNQQLKYKIQKLVNQLRSIQKQNQKLKQQCKIMELQVQKSTVSKQELIKAMRKSQTQELIGILKSGYSNVSQKNLHRFGQASIKECTNSQSQLNSFNRPPIQPEQKAIDKAKLQMQINSLQTELNQYRKQLDSMNYQLSRYKRLNEDRSVQVQRKDGELRQFRLRAQKMQTERNRQFISLRNQIQMMKSRQTERLQKAKQLDQYQTAISLKLAFYERKIKEHLDTIDRKQSIIQKLQMNRNQMQDKNKMYEDNMHKMSDQLQFLRKFKQDSSRKEDLLKQYKSKVEKLKQESQEAKSQLFQVKKDKHRIQKQIQSKDQYIASLKSKQEKQPPQKSEDNIKQNNKIRQIKNSYEIKLRNLRKQKQQLYHSLNEMRDIVLNKVEQILAKQIPTGKKKTHQYEAAKLLGIKPGELDEFLNPGNVINKKISKQLEELWLEGNYTYFMNNFIQYIQIQAQPHDKIS